MRLRCVFFGDSITAGQYVEAELHWTALLAERFSAEAEFSVGAVSGETTRQALERFPREVQEVRPHVVTIQFGLNDCNHWVTDEGLPRVSLPAYRANLEEMVTRARHFGAAAVILSTNHPTLKGPMADGEEYEHWRRRYDDETRAVAGRLGCLLNDVERGFAGQTLAPLLLPAPDVLHLTPEGHRLYADVSAPVLASALERAREAGA